MLVDILLQLKTSIPETVLILTAMAIGIIAGGFLAAKLEADWEEKTGDKSK